METRGAKDRIDLLPEHAASAPQPAADGQRTNWMDVLKAYMALHVARAAERVLERRAEARELAPEAGRLGGEVRAATMDRPTAARPPAARREAKVDDKNAAKEATTGTPTGVWPIAKTTFKEFSRDNGMLMAAAVAFYMFLSLIPLIVVGVAVAGYFLSGNAAAFDRVMEFVGTFMAAGKENVQDIVRAVVEARGRIGAFGLATLALTATAGFATLENAINVIWGAPARNFIKSKLFALAMLVIIGALFLLSFALTFVSSLLTTWAHAIPGLGKFADNWGLTALGFVLSLMVSGLMFTAIFKLFPNAEVKWKPALIAGFVTAALWEVFKIGYTWYNNHQVASQEATYGSLGSLVGLVLWILYSCALVLLGSELTWVLTGRPGGEKKHPSDAGASEGGA